MEKKQDHAQVHCYTNPSFSRQSECIPKDTNSDYIDLPPPPQFKLDDLPPPPTVHQLELQFGQSNSTFNNYLEIEHNNDQLHKENILKLNHTNVDQYCYIDDSLNQQLSPVDIISHKQYGSLSLGDSNHHLYPYRVNQYEYIEDDLSLVELQKQEEKIKRTVSNASMYEFIKQKQIQQNEIPLNQQLQLQQRILVRNGDTSKNTVVISNRNTDVYYTDGIKTQKVSCNEENKSGWNMSRKQINTPRGCYTCLPTQDDNSPRIPEYNMSETSPHQVNNIATQKLHEILTTPQKSKTHLQVDSLSPIDSPHQQQSMLMRQNVTPTQHNIFSSGYSPSSIAATAVINSPIHIQEQQSSPYKRIMSSCNKVPMTSTPNKEPPSARRCLPLNSDSAVLRPMLHHQTKDNQYIYRGVCTDHQKNLSVGGALYQGVHGAFIARTAIVPPLSPPVSEANCTLVGDAEKSDKKNVPVILALVGILTCGLASYLSWMQGRRYYFDSTIGCGACCALAGVCRSMRRTWTGLFLAALAAVSCAGLLLLAAKSPRSGTPLHDVTAGALCGISLLGVVLALFALLTPRCSVGRHRRVHSWIPRFSP